LSIVTRLLIFTIIFLWTLAFLIELLIPYFEELSYFYPFAKSLFATVCHQQPEKLLTFNHTHSLVCSRCAGIYFGGLLSSFVLIFVRITNIKNGQIIILAAIPMVIDVILYSIGLYNYSKTIALITGILFGSVGIIYIYNGFQILLERND
jgi:uncharacterized membrane protein